MEIQFLCTLCLLSSMAESSNLIEHHEEVHVIPFHGLAGLKSCVVFYPVEVPLPSLMQSTYLCRLDAADITAYWGSMNSVYTPVYTGAAVCMHTWLYIWLPLFFIVAVKKQSTALFRWESLCQGGGGKPQSYLGRFRAVTSISPFISFCHLNPCERFSWCLLTYSSSRFWLNLFINICVVF